MKNVTIQDIAIAAGVSHATVERVLSKKGYVSAEKRERIEKIVEELGYVPNRLARSLKKQKSNIIGHIGLQSPNMVFPVFSLGMTKAAEREGYTIMNASINAEANGQADSVTDLAGFQMDGIVLTSIGDLKQSTVDKLRRMNISTVVVERCYGVTNVDKIVFDDESGARQATDYLYQQGCRRIAYVGITLEENIAVPEQYVERNRLIGYQAVLQQYGLPETLVFRDRYSIRDGYEAAKQLFSGMEKPDGIFATSDLYAVGICRYLFQNGYHIPEDIKLVGFDNTWVSALPMEVLSVTYEAEAAGYAAMELLKKRIEDRTREYETVIVPMHLERNVT